MADEQQDQAEELPKGYQYYWQEGQFAPVRVIASIKTRSDGKKTVLYSAHYDYGRHLMYAGLLYETEDEVWPLVRKTLEAKVPFERERLERLERALDVAKARST